MIHLIDEKLILLQPVLGPAKVNRLRQMYFYEDDYRRKKEIENYMDMLIVRHVKKSADDKIILPPPGMEACRGSLPVGDIEYLDRIFYPFGLNERDVNRHVGIFGATGSGKTTLALHLLRLFHKHKIPFLVFDWEKSYRNLAREFDDLQVFTVGADVHPLHMNILDVPPGITKEEFVKSLVSLLAEDYLSGAGSDTVIMNAMVQAYKDYQTPNFENLKEIVAKAVGKSNRGRTMLWHETVGRIFNFLSFGASGNILGSKYHFPLDKLFKQNAVLEFGNIQSPRDRKFIIHCIINWMFLWMQYHGIESEQLNQVIIFEEFHNITMKSREDNLISTLFRQARKYGLGLIAIDQTPSKIPDAVVANMNTTASFALSTNQDIHAMAKAMNLDGYKEHYLGMLETGQAIVHVKQRIAYPFLIRAPFVPSRGNITDEELRQAMKRFSDVSGPDRSGLEKPGMAHASPNHDTSSPLELEPLEKVVLTSIIERPLDGVDKRTRKLGVHPSSMSRIHDALIQKGIVKPVVIDRKKLFELTEAGLKSAEENRIPIPRKKTRGGLEHTYWVAEIVRFLKKQGFQPVCEENDIDIVDKTSSMAIEVETGKSNIGKNLLKLENSGMSNRFMLATRIPVAVRLKNLSPKHPSIHFLYIKDFFKLTREQMIRRAISPGHS